MEGHPAARLARHLGRPHFIGGGRTNPASIVSQVDTIANIAPGGAIQVLHDELTRLASHAGTTLSIGFLVSLVISLWFTNSGVSALFDALNIVYEEKEKRCLIKYYLETLTFTIATIIFVLLSIAIVVAIPVALSFMPLPGGGDGSARQDRAVANPARARCFGAGGALSLWPQPRRGTLALDHLGQCVCHRRMARPLGAVLVVHGAFRQLQQDLRLARRDHGLHDLDLDLARRHSRRRQV